MKRRRRVAPHRVAVVYKPIDRQVWPAAPRYRQAQRQHRQTLQTVVRAIHRADLACDLIQRFGALQQRRYDLVVTVGGDGTVLTTSHQITDVPVLAVNSAPHFSEGFLTGTDRRGFARLFNAFVAGRARPVPLQRLAVALNGRRLPEPVLNDLLIAEANPAMISRYALTVAGRTEIQRSSGVWVATAAGSTAAIRSAGGRVLPLRSRAFQYVVRELYAGRRLGGRVPRLRRGVVTPPAAIRLRSLMHRGMIFIDGARIRYAVRHGDRLVVRVGGPPLWVIGLKRR